MSVVLYGSNVVALDPGKNNLGWAIFEGTTLKACGLSRTNKKTLGERALELRDNIAFFFYHRTHLTAVVEQMVDYPYRQGSPQARISKTKALLELQAIANFVAGSLSPTKLVHLKPAEWKGQVTKEISASRTLRKLSDEELQIVTGGILKVPASLRHNVYDAIGIGLSYLER